MAKVYKVTVYKDGSDRDVETLFDDNGREDLEGLKTAVGRLNGQYEYIQGTNDFDVNTMMLPLPTDVEADAKEYYVIVGPWKKKKGLEDFLKDSPKKPSIQPEEEPPAGTRWWLSRRDKGEHFRLGWFLTRPGTWTAATLALILMGILVPVAAPGFIVAAAITTGFAAISLILNIPDTKRYIKELWNENTNSENPGTFTNFLKNSGEALKVWAKKYPVQATIVGIAVGLLVTTLTLTIGFFTGGGAFAVVGGALVATGGGAFAFMAPVFTTLAAPFAAAAAAAGAELSVAALASATFILAGLAVPDLLRRLADWMGGIVVDLWGMSPVKISTTHDDTSLLRDVEPSLVPKGGPTNNPIVYAGRFFKGFGILTGLVNSQYNAIRDKWLMNSTPEEQELEELVDDNDKKYR